MPRYRYFVICAICLLSPLLTGCVEDADDPLTEGDVIGMLGPALTGSTPPAGASIHPDQSLKFFFNKPVSVVKVNGESIVLSVDRTQATFQGKLETGKLTVFWQWPQGMREKEFKFVILQPDPPASDPSTIPVKVTEPEKEIIEPEEEVIPQKEIDTTVLVDPAVVESPAVGEDLKISIKISQGNNIAGYQFTLEFDSTALEFVFLRNADFLPAGSFAMPAKVNGDKVTLAATSLVGGTNGDGTLAKATFKVLKKSDSALKLSGVKLSDPDATAITLQTVDGEVVVSVI